MYPVPPFRPLATYIKIDVPQKRNMGSQVRPYIDYIHLLMVVFIGMKGYAFGGVQTNGWKIRECCDIRSDRVTDRIGRLRRLAAGLPPRRPGFDPGSVRVVFVVDKVALGQVFPRVLRFSPVSFIPPVLHY
jgi:hypothetical protein